MENLEENLARVFTSMAAMENKTFFGEL